MDIYLHWRQIVVHFEWEFNEQKNYFKKSRKNTLKGVKKEYRPD